MPPMNQATLDAQHVREIDAAPDRPKAFLLSFRYFAPRWSDWAAVEPLLLAYYSRRFDSQGDSVRAPNGLTPDEVGRHISGVETLFRRKGSSDDRDAFARLVEDFIGRRMEPFWLRMNRMNRRATRAEIDQERARHRPDAVKAAYARLFERWVLVDWDATQARYAAARAKVYGR